MKPTTKQRLIALAATIIFHGAIVLLLVMTWLMPSEPDVVKRVWEEDESEILFGNEYVMTGDVDILADNNSANEPTASVTEASTTPAAEAMDLDTHGDAGEKAPQLSSKQPSPAKATTRPEPDKRGNRTKTDDKAAAEKAAQEAAAAISKRTNFSTTPTPADPKGNTGSPDSNTEKEASAGTPGFFLSGRTMASWKKPSATATGTIVINVKVNREGVVTHATYGKGSGPVASNAAARQSCISAALGSRFSVIEDGPAEQLGTITYRFR